MQLGEEESKSEFEKIGGSSALTKITNAGYSALNLTHYFTCGPDEVRRGACGARLTSSG